MTQNFITLTLQLGKLAIGGKKNLEQPIKMYWDQISHKKIIEPTQKLCSPAKLQKPILK